MKSYVKMERFSLSLFSLSSLYLCVYPGRLEEHVYGGLRENNVYFMCYYIRIFVQVSKSSIH